MCYNLKYYERKIKKLARREGLDESEIEKIPGFHFVTGFSHPDLITIKDSAPKVLSPLSWGLIPFWVKNSVDAVKISNQTLNAVGETLFEKPAFRLAARERRCVIIVDGFYEYHHLNSKMKIPFYIHRTDGEPMILAGVWDTWKSDVEGISRHTVSIVTTKANKKMTKIHNNPVAIQRNGPRMPVILPDELMDDWLRHDGDDKAEIERLQSLLISFPDDLLNFHAVATLSGKVGTGNTPRASEPFEWGIKEIEKLS